MKKILLALALPCATSALYAQEFLCVNGYWSSDVIPVEHIDHISFGEVAVETLPEVMAKDPNIKIFNEALQLTGLCDSLQAIYDNEFYYEHELVQSFYRNQQSYALQKLRKGFTAFVETDKTLALYGIGSLADLKAYAAKVYDEMYPEDAGVTDPTDRRNSLNRFVAYHLLDRKATQNELTAAGISNELAGNVAEKYNREAVDIADWYETLMPHSLLKCSAPRMNGQDMVYVNRRGLQDHADDRGVLVEGAVLDPSFQGVAINGYYHYIGGIIAYDKQTQEVVLDEQIIVNNSTISPEFMNNGMRISRAYPVISNDNEVFLPAGSLKNVQVNSDDTRMYYLFNKAWHDVQTDEFLITGLFDLTIKLPSLPAGTYELNIGYSPSASRNVAEAYLDGELCGTIDQRYVGQSVEVGWVDDNLLGTPEAIAENDKQMFDNGYRKGLAYCRDASGQPLRDVAYCLRRIITTFTTDGKSDHYLRFKNVNASDDGSAQFMIDFLELCPTHILPEYK